ncbi:MAG: hypothetical protein LBO77_09080 [Desulfovibrio sp.]|jgi:hypothetical protein|nr:hypothetical protein [Desulfovibrio sp.]
MKILQARLCKFLPLLLALFCALQSAPAGAAWPFLSAGRYDPAARCPIFSTASAPETDACSAPAAGIRKLSAGEHAGAARHGAPPAQEQNCPCDPSSMPCSSSLSSPALLTAGESLTAPTQRALPLFHSYTHVKSLHPGNLFRPPRHTALRADSARFCFA